jgi:hypothetical protein
MDPQDFSDEMWVDLAEVIFQGIELSECEHILREEQKSAEERHLSLPMGHAEDFVSMFFNRYQGIKDQIQGRAQVVQTLAVLLETAVSLTGDPGVGTAFREQMMQYIPYRNEAFRKAARTLIGDYMEE